MSLLEVRGVERESGEREWRDALRRHALTQAARRLAEKACIKLSLNVDDKRKQENKDDAPWSARSYSHAPPYIPRDVSN